jgi:hypothetical protein
MTYEHLVFIVKCDAILDDNDTATTRVYAPDLLMSGGNQEVGYLYCLYINDITKQSLDIEFGLKKRGKNKESYDWTSRVCRHSSGKIEKAVCCTSSIIRRSFHVLCGQ